jgi:hypothetical protein
MSQFPAHYTDTAAGRLLTDALYVGQIALNFSANTRDAHQTHGLTSRLVCNPVLRARLGFSVQDNKRISQYTSPYQISGKTAVLSDAQLVANGVAMGIAVAHCPRILPVLSLIIEEAAADLKIQGKAAEAFLAEYEHGPLQHEASWRQVFLLTATPDLNFKPNGFLYSAREIATLRGHDLLAEMMPQTGALVRKLLKPGPQ